MASVQVGKTFDYNFARRDRPQAVDFNLRWDDIDRRISQTEAFMPSWDAVVNGITSDAVSRIDGVITPIALGLLKVAQLGFLLAYSTDSATLHDGDVHVFTIQAGDVRNLFTPTPFIAIERISTPDFLAVAQTVSYDKPSGALAVRILKIAVDPSGTGGPFNDWSFTVSPGVSESIRAMLSTVSADTATVVAAQSDVAANQRQVASDATGANTAAANAAASAGQAATSAQAAAAYAKSLNAANYLLVDGSTPFKAVQKGVAPAAGTNDASLVTAAWTLSAILSGVMTNGRIDGTPIGQSQPAAAAFTIVSSSGYSAVYAPGGPPNENTGTAGGTYGTADGGDITGRVESGFFQYPTPSTAKGWPVTGSWMQLLTSTHSNTQNYYSMQFCCSFFDQTLYFRQTAGFGANGWNKVWHSGSTFAAASAIWAGTDSTTPLTSATLAGVSAIQNITANGATALNLGAGNVFLLSLSANSTLQAPTNPIHGRVYQLHLQQANGGSKTMAWPSNFNWGAAGVPVLTTTNGKRDIVSIQYDATVPGYYCVLNAKGF